MSSRYQRDRIAAQRKADADRHDVKSSVTNSPNVDEEKTRLQAEGSQKQVLDSESDGARIIGDEIREEQEVKQVTQRPRRRKSGFDPKALSDRVAGSLHGRSSAILHADGAH